MTGKPSLIGPFQIFPPTPTTMENLLDQAAQQLHRYYSESDPVPGARCPSPKCTNTAEVARVGLSIHGSYPAYRCQACGFVFYTRKPMEDEEDKARG